MEAVMSPDLMYAPLAPAKPKVPRELLIPMTLEDCARWVESYNRFVDAYWKSTKDPEGMFPEWDDAIIGGYRTFYGQSTLGFRTRDGRSFVMRFLGFRYGDMKPVSMDKLVWAAEIREREVKR
jgi:hypothetical protein